MIHCYITFLLRNFWILLFVRNAVTKLNILNVLEMILGKMLPLSHVMNVLFSSFFIYFEHLFLFLYLTMGLLITELVNRFANAMYLIVSSSS